MIPCDKHGIDPAVNANAGELFVDTQVDATKVCCGEVGA